MTSPLYGAIGISGGGFGADSRLFTYDPYDVVAPGGFIRDPVGSIGRITCGVGDALALRPGSGVLYGVTSSEDGTPGDFLSIDRSTAVPTLIAALSLGANDLVFDISFRSDGVLFAAVYLDGPFETRLQTIDLATGVCTDVGLMNAGFKPGALCFDGDDVLWAALNITGKRLCTVDQSTGALTVVFASLTNNTSGNSGLDGGCFKVGATGLFYAHEDSGISSRSFVTVDVVAGTIDPTTLTTNGVVGLPGGLAWAPPTTGPTLEGEFRVA